MADKPMDQISMDEKVAQAKELLSIATRNYYVKEYADAVDDFSTVCSIYSEIYGPAADELGMPYLMYAKCLVAVGQDENKVMDIPEEDEEDEDAEEGGQDEEGEGEAEEGPADAANGGSAEKEAEEKQAAPEEPQPGSSTGITAATSAVDGFDDVKDDEDEDDIANLQVAWEVLELAVTIFSRHSDKAKELAECYIELAGISFENSNFEAAIKDYSKSLDILQEMPEKNNREFAEIHYKVGLAQIMLNQFDESTVALQKACAHLDQVIAVETAKEETEETKSVIKDLKETKQEILNKIAEVEEYKQQSFAEIKMELSKLMGNGGPSEGIVSSTSSTAESGKTTDAASVKPAADISHLIKRKKPSEEAAVTSPTKTANEVGGDEAASPPNKRKK